jgi:uncharacterized protein involved in outer membrane biogenesis
MKKILLVIVAVVVVVILGALAYGAHLVRKLNSPEFQEQVRAEVSRQLGAEVRVAEMDISLLSGLTLRGVAVANPEPFEGDLFTAESFELRYKLRPLLSGRVEVERLTLDKPILGLIVDEEGRFNYEALGGKKPAVSGPEPPSGADPAAGPAADAPSGAAEAAALLDIVLSEVGVRDARITMIDDEDTNLMTIEDVDFAAALEVSDGVTRGQAKASISTVSMADVLFVREIEAPLTLSKEQVLLSPIEGRVAGGKATGEMTTHLQDGFRYEGELDLTGVSVETLLQEAQSNFRVAGTLRGTMSFEGTGPMSTLKANGQAQVVDCRVEDSKMLALLSTVLKVPELASPEFQDCRIEYSLANNVLSTSVLSLKGQAIEITGKGRLNLVRSTINYDLNLALTEALLNKITVPQLRGAFEPRGDGFSEISFRAYGTTDAPETDLLTRVGRAAAEDAVKDQANKLLRKIF